MGKVFVEDTEMQDIANAIREKNGTDTKYLPSEMGGAIRELVTDGFSYDDIASNNIEGNVILNVEKVHQYAFKGNNLLSVVGENVKWIGDECFWYSTISYAYFRNLTSDCPINAFRNCSYLEKLDLGFAKKINMGAFMNAKILDTIILRGNQVCNLATTNAFDGTPFSTTGKIGEIFVPSSLIDGYKTATNWSVLHEKGTCIFKSIEGSEYE